MCALQDPCPSCGKSKGGSITASPNCGVSERHTVANYKARELVSAMPTKLLLKSDHTLWARTSLKFVDALMRLFFRPPGTRAISGSARWVRLIGIFTHRHVAYPAGRITSKCTIM
jgi:hypothetical protein